MSAAIVNYRDYDNTRRAVDTLLRHTVGVELHLYVIDNASGDGCARRLKDEFPGVTVIENDVNGGFGYGHNRVLGGLDSAFHAVVNPDIFVDRDVLSELCAYMRDNPDVGLVTPKILNADGSDQLLPKRDPAVLALVGRRVFAKALRRQVEHYQMLDEDLSQTRDIEFSTGSFFVIETELFERLQGFDPRFFMYYEDMDITRRARALKRTVYCPFTHVYHLWRRSSASSARYFWVLVVGMFKYFGKWGWKFRYSGDELAAAARSDVTPPGER
uniref:Putative glycosyltransferase n=1 Tax=uncultured bacterium contig00006 TaxID=1181498 RepID=A0A806KN96_9BACT|nr:putative glycosyltransferase [uncultured bacterium contig00006]